MALVAVAKRITASGVLQYPKRPALVEIGVALSNPRAMALYQRLGFVEDRVINLDLGSGAEPVMYLKIALRS